MNVRSVLDDAIVTLRGIPEVVLESALVLPGRTPESLAQLEERVGLRFPPGVAQLYTQVGGMHVSWRLGLAGYEKLGPGGTENRYRYDVSGNLDLLPPEDVMGGFTGRGWKHLYAGRAGDYLPVDFSGFYINMGFDPSAGQETDHLILFDLYEDRQVPLEVPLAEYLQRGADLLFMNEWQLALLSGEESERLRSSLSELKTRLGVPAAHRRA